MSKPKKKSSTRPAHSAEQQLPLEVDGAGSLQDGTPTDQDGTPTDQAGTPIDQEGTPTDQEGTPTDRAGTPTDQEGTPTDQAGTPTDQATDQEGTPTGQPPETDDLLQWLREESQDGKSQGGTPTKPPPTTEELLQYLREEARYLQLESKEDPAPGAAPVFPVWAAQDFEFPVKPSYHINEFLLHDDIDFVVNAYRGLLQREPDEVGLDRYVALLREQGEAGKLPTILILLHSEEGRAAGVHVKGIRWERFAFRNQHRWWFRKRVTRFLFEFSRHLLGDGLKQHLLEQSRHRQKFEQSVDRFLGRQQQFLDQVQARQQEIQEQQETARQALDGSRREMLLTRQDLLAQQRRLNLVLEELRKQLDDETLSPAQKQALAAQAGEKLDAFYLQFENQCRGDETEIREQLAIYLPRLQALPVLSADTPLLDIGSGRGEWLGLLRDQGIAARGVDISAILARHCTEQGLEVALQDAVAFLRGQPDASLGAITAFHVIEHLPFETLFSLVEECQRVLTPGGLLLFETPNPENVQVGSHTFYHDPTHRNPVTPTMIEHLLRHLGLVDIDIERLHPYPEEARTPGLDPLTERINGAFCGPQDFAVFARKPD